MSSCKSFKKNTNPRVGLANYQQKYSYCGPGTKYKQCTKKGCKGINELHSMCKLLDKFIMKTLTPKFEILVTSL